MVYCNYRGKRGRQRDGDREQVTEIVCEREGVRDKERHRQRGRERERGRERGGGIHKIHQSR